MTLISTSYYSYIQWRMDDCKLVVSVINMIMWQQTITHTKVISNKTAKNLFLFGIWIKDKTEKVKTRVCGKLQLCLNLHSLSIVVLNTYCRNKSHIQTLPTDSTHCIYQYHIQFFGIVWIVYVKKWFIKNALSSCLD